MGNRTKPMRHMLLVRLTPRCLISRTGVPECVIHNEAIYSAAGIAVVNKGQQKRRPMCRRRRACSISRQHGEQWAGRDSGIRRVPRVGCYVLTLYLT
jgi:hypothetical protein